MNIGYYVKGDTKQEILKSGSFDSMQQAISTFAQLKGLPEETFLTLFSVIYMKTK